MFDYPADLRPYFASRYPTPKLTAEGIAKVINGLERPESMDMLRLPAGVNECDFGILTPREQQMILQYAHRLEDRFKEALAKEQADAGKQGEQQ